MEKLQHLIDEDSISALDAYVLSFMTQVPKPDQRGVFDKFIANSRVSERVKKSLERFIAEETETLEDSSPV